MAKGIIVVDMPNGCIECRLKNEYDDCIFHDEEYYDFDEQFENCPIKPMPEKMKSQSRQGWFGKAVAAGWNRCINTILGGSDEQE